MAGLERASRIHRTAPSITHQHGFAWALLYEPGVDNIAWCLYSTADDRSSAGSDPDLRPTSAPRLYAWPKSAVYLYLIKTVEELSGVLPALISPLHSDGAVDEAAVARLVEHLIRGGVTGLLALGSTGETAALDENARRTMLSSTVAAAAGRVSVICGVAQSHLSAARTKLEAAARLGAMAALVAPSYFRQHAD